MHPTCTPQGCQMYPEKCVVCNSCIVHVKWVFRPRKKKETLFYGRTDLPSKVGRLHDFFFFNLIFFYLLFQKKPPKHENFKKTLIFLQKNFGKIFRLTFKKFQPKFSDLGQQMAGFTIFGKKQFSAKKKIWVGRACKTEFSFFVALW